MRFARTTTQQLLERYVFVNSQDGPAQSTLGTLYAHDKLREQALTHSKAALALAPKNPTVLADIAQTYDDLGDRKRAIQYAKESLKNGYTLTDLQRQPALQQLLADPSFRPREKQ
jgi:predicted Zn-dependent protease